MHIAEKHLAGGNLSGMGGLLSFHLPACMRTEVLDFSGKLLLIVPVEHDFDNTREPMLLIFDARLKMVVHDVQEATEILIICIPH